MIGLGKGGEGEKKGNRMFDDGQSQRRAALVFAAEIFIYPSKGMSHSVTYEQPAEKHGCCLELFTCRQEARDREYVDEKMMALFDALACHDRLPLCSPLRLHYCHLC
jgi:hypothetical protein